MTKPRSAYQTSLDTAFTPGDPPLIPYFETMLQELYTAELLLTRVIPRLQLAAGSRELTRALAEHLQTTKRQIRRIELIGKMMNKPCEVNGSKTMEMLVVTGEMAITKMRAAMLSKEVAIVISLQRMDHFTLATYAALIQLADMLGFPDAASLLRNSVEEKKEAEQLLAEIVRGHIYQDVEAEA